MTTILAIITVLSYLFGAMAFLLAAGHSDIQYILAGVYFICGTVALAGIGIVNALDNVKRRLPEPHEKPQEFHP